MTKEIDHSKVKVIPLKVHSLKSRVSIDSLRRKIDLKMVKRKIEREKEND